LRTDRVNVIFMLMAQLANNTGAKEKGQTNALACLSLSAEGQGFEPWIPFDRYTHFPGVPLQPLEHLSFYLPLLLCSRQMGCKSNHSIDNLINY
jgi:hypothetical protein